jgi:hypothetical protein
MGGSSKPRKEKKKERRVNNDGKPCPTSSDIFQSSLKIKVKDLGTVAKKTYDLYAGSRTVFTYENLSPHLQARFCKLYHADFFV